MRAHAQHRLQGRPFVKSAVYHSVAGLMQKIVDHDAEPWVFGVPNVQQSSRTNDSYQTIQTARRVEEALLSMTCWEIQRLLTKPTADAIQQTFHRGTDVRLRGRFKPHRCRWHPAGGLRNFPSVCVWIGCAGLSRWCSKTTPVVKIIFCAIIYSMFNEQILDLLKIF